MNPDYSQVNLLLNEHHNLKRSFYKYKNLLTSSNLKKCNLQFLRRCLEDKIMPKSLIPRSVKTNMAPFPYIYEALLRHHIQETKQLINKSFFITKLKFQIFQNNFYRISNNHSLLSDLIDKAHHIMKIKTTTRKNSHKEKIENLFNNSKWVSHSNHNIIINLSDYELNTTEKTLLGYGLSFSLKNPDPWIDLIKNFTNWKKSTLLDDINQDILFGIILQLTKINVSNTEFPRRFYKV